MITIPASTATLSSVGVTATVLMMSAATRNSRPSRIALPRLERKFATASSRSAPFANRTANSASVQKAPSAMMPMPNSSTILATRCAISVAVWSNMLGKMLEVLDKLTQRLFTSRPS